MLIETFSGIRGIFSESLTEEVAQKYALAYVSLLTKKKANPVIVIGTDTRLSNQIIKSAILEILQCDIIDVGTAPTPAVEFAVREYKADGGIIITASHNEPYWNGFKFLQKDGAILKEKDMDKVIKTYQKIKKISSEQAFKDLKVKVKKKKRSDRKHDDLIKRYSDFVLSFVKKDIAKIRNSRIKVVIDPNGGTGIIAKDILKDAGVKVHGVNMEYGIFNRKVEPDYESLLYLGNIARDENAELAAGFDCDADRLQIILPDNKMVSGHYLLAIISNEILKKSKKKVIVVNDATSSVVKEVAVKNKARYVEVQVGETNVVEGMKKNKAKVGGEGSSGGVIIAPSRCRDGILTLLILIKIIADKKADLGRIIKDYPKYFTQAKNVKLDPNDTSNIEKKIQKFYEKKKYNVITQEKEGGSIKVFVDEETFVWFRRSKTEGNLFRIIVDSNDKEKTEKLLKEAESIFD